jgi:hypothetical protein
MVVSDFVCVRACACVCLCLLLPCCAFHEVNTKRKAQNAKRKTLIRLTKTLVFTIFHMANMIVYIRWLFRVQLVFGAVYGILLLIAPLPLIRISAKTPVFADAVAQNDAVSLDTRILTDFARWLGAAHLLFGVLAWRGLYLCNLSSRNGSLTLTSSQDVTEHLKTICLASAVYFGLSSFVIDTHSIALGNWQHWALLPAAIIEAIFTIGHILIIATARSESDSLATNAKTTQSKSL